MFRGAKLLSTFAVAAGLSLVGGGVSAQGQSVDSFGATFLTATLSGANEVAGGDPDGSGRAVVRLRDTEVCFLLSWSNIAAPTAGHIHIGAAGANGPVRVGFFAGALPATLTAVAGCVTSDAATVDAIKANPAGFYVNLHNADFPGGAIRGQLGRLGVAAALDGSLTNSLTNSLANRNLLALAFGRNEVPGPGDADGRALALFHVGTDSVDFAIAWQNLAPPTAAHIHSGAAGTAGPVVVGLFAATGGLPASITAVAGTTAGAADVLTTVRRNPAGFYFNMHNAEFPAGAIRGQLIG